jgi:SpoIVB peptidase S55
MASGWKKLAAKRIVLGRESLRRGGRVNARGKSRGRSLLALLVAVTALAVSAPAVAAPDKCPEILPTAEVEIGMVGTGWTVDRGTTVKPFDVTVLGVLPDAIAPGRDMIIVEGSSPAIDAAGGIWFGMSGSPVYVGGELIGAVAFGLTFGPSPIAGLTPASDLLTVAGYPAASARKAPNRVTLPRYLARRVAQASGRSVAASSSLSRLKMPLTVSGVDERGMRRVNQMVKRKRLAALPYRGASARASATSSSSKVVPGGNFAAALSYGDVTIAGIGTTSYVCDGKAVAFGHPFFFLGPTTMGANVATALGVIADPLGGAFKLANLGGAVGALDQDRLAGVRAQLGPGPSTTPIGSQVTSLDTGLSRQGRTDAVLKDFLPDLAFLHVLSNMDSVFDAIGPGSSSLHWTISGTQGRGEPWTFEHGNLYASEFDVSIESSFELADELFAIGFFRRDGVTVEDVSLTADVEGTVRKLEIVRVLVKRNGEYRPAGQQIHARPGQLLGLRIVLRRFKDGQRQNVDFVVRMPRNLENGALLEITGGARCEGEGCVIGAPATFDALLAKLEARPRNNVLAVRLRAGLRLRVRSTRSRSFDQVVDGQRTIFILPPGAPGPEGPRH